jgi:acyl-CoA synthetase (AMP-forming)/AMP-acid ligase II
VSAGRAERLFAALENGGDRQALLFEGRSLTYASLDRSSRAYASGLAAHGISAGDRVAVYAETCPEVVIALLGHYRRGASHVPVNSRYRGEELAHILADSGASAVLVEAGGERERVLDTLGGPRIRRILLGPGPAGDASDLRFDSLLETGGGPRPERPSDEDTALLLYTSGTTGKSKRVLLSFRAVVDNILAVTGLWRFEPGDRQALALPLFHVHGLCLGIHGALLHGQTAVLLQRFEPARAVRAFAEEGATVFQGVPTMYTQLLEHMAAEPRAADALRRGRLFTAGSAALSADDFSAFEELTGHRILERYGMSETLFTLSNPYEDRRPGTVGLPVPGCEARIAGDGGEDALPGEMGELLVRSNGMMSGYRGRPDETAESFTDGWFRTGDVARRDAGGYVSLVGRKSLDVIKSGGFKISAREIEDVLRRHPGVRDVAVLGIPDRVYGQTILAAVVWEGPAPGEAGALDELSAFCRRHLADYKRPRAVRILAELPRNALGKVQKHRILESL